MLVRGLENGGGFQQDLLDFFFRVLSAFSHARASLFDFTIPYMPVQVLRPEGPGPALAGAGRINAATILGEHYTGSAPGLQDVETI